MGYLDPNAGKSDLLAYLYGPSNAPQAPNARARNPHGHVYSSEFAGVAP